MNNKVTVCISGWLVCLPTEKYLAPDSNVEIAVDVGDDNIEVWHGEVVDCAPNEKQEPRSKPTDAEVEIAVRSLLVDYMHNHDIGELTFTFTASKDYPHPDHPMLDVEVEVTHNVPKD